MSEKIIAFIQKDVKKLLARDEFKLDPNRKKKKDPKDQEEVLLLNNSFFDRKESDTSKSNQYLVFDVLKNGKLDAIPSVAISRGKQISEHKQAKSKRDLNLTPFEKAIKEELSGLGDMVFALIGEIEDNCIEEEEIKTGDLDYVCWSPSSIDIVTIKNKKLILKNLNDEGFIHSEIEAIYAAKAAALPQDLISEVDVAIRKLKTRANIILRVPLSKARLPKNGILERTIVSIKAHQTEYKKNLTAWANSGYTNPNFKHEVFRVAYDLSNDALKLVNLIINFCDVKPLLMWGTIAEHYNFYKAIEDLQLHAGSKKASLSIYQHAISASRNKAFHSVFPIDNTLDIVLPNNRLNELRFRIFSEHKDRKQNKIMFKDQELAELFFLFTRSTEKSLPNRFWQDNLRVIDATIDLLTATNNFLYVLLKA